MERGFQYWLRWILLLPISLILAILCDFPLHWILYRTLSGGENPFIYPYPELPERILAPFIRSLVFVWMASRIAPEHKFKTAIFVSTLWIFGAGVAFSVGYLVSKLTKYEWN